MTPPCRIRSAAAADATDATPGWRRRQWLAAAATAPGWGVAAGLLGPVGAWATATTKAPTQAEPPAQTPPPGLPLARATPGGVALLDLGAAPERPEARWQDRPLLVLGQPAQWHALLGIALAQAPGRLAVQVRRGAAAPQTLAVDVQPHRYAEQRLKVSPKHVDLSPEDLARHERERSHQAALMARYSEGLPPSVRMRAPTPGPRSSSFGLRRVFNGQPRAPHSGMDIAAPTGTPVVAPLAAEVVDVGDYFFNGRTVWLDHGGGLLSMVCHLSQMHAAVGDRLAAGQRFADVGATGRVTGAHLHWSVCLNRALVDPALFLLDGA